MSKSWAAHILTLFPDMFPGPLGCSLAGKALAAGIWRLETHDIRDFAEDRHRTVDDTPAGGGAGMVMRADVLAAAIDRVSEQDLGRNVEDNGRRLVYLTPRGVPLDQEMVRDLAAGAGVTLVCGRFEGMDERIYEARPGIEISLGDFVLSGGEPAAIALIDAVVRLLPGVVGDPRALEEESFESNLLEYPQYTRPAEWEGREIPEVLTSGNHGRIATWRRTAAERLTRRRRPDLWKQYVAKQTKPE